MTNLVSILASIVTSLSTNITTTDNRPSRWIPEPCPDAFKNPFYGCLVNHGRFEKYGEATEKTETEIVTEQHFEVIPVHGVNAYHFEAVSSKWPVNNPVTVEESRKLVFQREISRVSRTYKLDQQWKLSDTKTNALAYDPWKFYPVGSNYPTITNYLLFPDQQLEIVTNEAGLIVIRSK